MISPIKSFFNHNELFIKVLKNYLKYYPYDDCMIIYLKNFLWLKSHCLKRDIFKYIKKFKNDE